MKSLLLALSVITASVQSFADSQFLNQANVAAKTYHCSNGGDLQLSNTRYGNVKKIVFAQSRALNEIGYVSFWSMTDSYKGDVVTSMTFPDPRSGDEPQRGHTIAEVQVQFDGQGLSLSLKPVSSDARWAAFTCKNY